LSGRENIYNNGAILGFSRKEIDEKIEAIIEFAGIPEFIDMPVQNYSSGMKVRLGFSVAAQMQPDVLIIDEVLAVGDLGFVLKCFKTIDTILPNTAIVFVSHSMPMVSRICNHIILLERGKVQFHGENVGKAIDLYYRSFAQKKSNVVFSDGSIELEKAEILNAKCYQNNIPQLNWGDDLNLSFSFTINQLMEVPTFKLNIYDKELRPIAILAPNTIDSNISIENKKIKFNVNHNQLQFSKGVYTIDIAIFKFGTSNNPLLRMNGILSFQVVHQDDHFQPFLLSATYGK